MEFPDFSGCRCPTPSAARRRELRCDQRDRRPKPCAPAGQCKRETPPAFYPTLSEPKLVWFVRPECAAIPAPAARSGWQTAARTSPRQEDAPKQRRQEGTASRYCSRKIEFRKIFAFVTMERGPIGSGTRTARLRLPQSSAVVAAAGEAGAARHACAPKD